MSTAPELHTPRLILRRWRDGDRVPFAKLNRDAQVMEHMPARLTRAQSDEMIELIEARFDQHGYGLWAVEVRATGALAGFTGLQDVPFQAPFTPAIEVGWRLARTVWGRGYATEAARAALAYGFGALRLPEVVAMIVPANRRSRAVAQRLDMTQDPAGAFEHPRFAPGHRLRRHLLYRLSATQAAEASALGGSRRDTIFDTPSPPIETP